MRAKSENTVFVQQMTKMNYPHKFLSGHCFDRLKKWDRYPTHPEKKRCTMYANKITPVSAYNRPAVLLCECRKLRRLYCLA